MPHLDPFAPNEAPRLRSCDRPGCAGKGEFRAPKGRDSLNEFYWFCTDHIRDYNKAWNYCAGMSAAEIEAEIRQDTVWRRPTWPLGNFNRPGRWQNMNRASFHDGFAGFDVDEMAENEEDGEAFRPRPGTPEARAMRLMQLESPLTLTQLKARYKELVKQLHPDANGGDKLAEERLKDINEAYSTLKKAVRPNGLDGHP